MSGSSTSVALGQQLLGMGRERDLGFEEASGTEFAQSLLADVLVHDRADAGDAGVQRNLPEPAVFVGLDEDVAVVGRIEVCGVAVVAVDGEVLEVLVPLVQVQLAAEQRGLPAGVDEEAAVNLAGFAMSHVFDAGDAVVV